MRILGNWLACWCAILMSVFLFAAEAAPANDPFANAFLLDPALTVTQGSNVGATSEPGEPSHAEVRGGKSVWWIYDAPQTGFLTVSTLDSRTPANFEMDTILAVYTGSSVSALTLVAFNDDDSESDSYGSKVIIPVRSGTRYYIAVDGYPYEEGTEVGNIVLRYTYSLKFPAKAEPQWTLPGVDGTTVRSTSFAGEVRLVNFWATWCGPCIVEIPDLIAVQNKFERFGFSVIGISIDNPQAPGQPPIDLVANFAIEHGMNYPIVMTRPASSAVESQYGDVSAIPTTFVVDRNNHIVRTVVGSRDQAFFESLLKPFLFDNIALNVRREGAETVIEWPSLAGVVSAQLETAPAANGTWGVSNEEATDNGTTTAVRIDSNSLRFYRLRINL